MRVYNDKNFQYAKSRLNDTIIRVKGELIQFMDVAPSLEYLQQYHIPDYDGDVAPPYIVAKVVKTGDVSVYSIDDLDLSPLPLGYVNLDGCCIYITRLPLRNDWKQGTRITNLRDEFGNPPTYLDYQWLIPTVEGTFPSFDECVGLVGKGSIRQAWSKNWAVGCTGQIHHKGVRVGDLVENSITLYSNYEYLSESLNESLS